MFSLCRKLLILTMAMFSLAMEAQQTLRVCADPDNLPFSNQSRAGFDNRIAELLAERIGRKAVFVWARARRGFLRERFNQGDCDLLMGTPEGLKRVRQTIPYYLSSYVFVTRKEDHLVLSRFNDPSIGNRRIGLQILEEDFSPPSLPLIRYGHAAQLVGFESFGHNSGEIIQAVANKRVGLAVVWGPVAGYYASRQKTPLSLTPVPPLESGIPFRYAMAVAVHTRDIELESQLNRAIVEERSSIRKILNAYHVPQTEVNEGSQ
jgi:mxaJ protein